MARNTFGGTDDDYTVSLPTVAGRRVLSPAGNQALTFWDTATGGTRHTDLLDGSGAAVTAISSDSDGFIPTFSGPDGVTQMWADAGGTSRKLLVTRDLSGSDALTAGFVSDDTPSATRTALSDSFAMKSSRITDLPTPFYAAHRGGAGISPEETAEAYRIAASAGADVLDGDTQTLADGGVVLMHDNSVDRTTDTTGNVSTFSAMSIKTLNAAANFPWNGQVVRPILMQEFLSEFGAQKVLQLEPKDQPNAGVIMDAAEAKGLKGNLIFATTSLTTLAAIKARGFYAMYSWLTSPTPDSSSVAAAVAAGADMLGCFGYDPATDADVALLVASGLPVQIWTVNRRYRRDQLLTAGVSGFLTNQPAYLKATTAQRTTVSWGQGIFGHGLIPGGTLANPADADILSGGVLSLPDSLDQSVNGYNYVLVGELCPIANRASTYTVTYQCAFDTVDTSTTAALSGLACALDDKPFIHTNGSYQQGYAPYLTMAGSLRFYRLDGPTSFTQLGVNTATAPLTAGGYATLELVVTPTTLTWTRTDSAVATLSAGLTSGVAVTSLPVNSLPRALVSGTKVRLSTGQVATLSAAASASATSLTVTSITPTSAVASGSSLYGTIQATDSTYRGGYLHIGKRDSLGHNGLYKNLAIT